MKPEKYDKFNKYVRDVMNYFRELEKARKLTKEEEQLIFRSLDVMTDIRFAYSKHLDKQEAVRQSNREKQKNALFKKHEIVFEGIVDDIYEPVYATDYKELRKKMSKYANLSPSEENTATVNTYEKGVLTKKETWVRRSTYANKTWSFGKWEIKETR